MEDKKAEESKGAEGQVVVADFRAALDRLQSDNDALRKKVSALEESIKNGQRYGVGRTTTL
jgi:ubiquinone biosynthesis protein UbiJ